MKVREIAPKAPVVVAPGATLAEAAALMDKANVGALVVLDGDDLTGIVTDRDIVLRGVARLMPPDARIDSVMSTNVLAIDADDDVREAYALLEKGAVRRLPVHADGRVVGMITADDLLVRISADLAELVQPIVGELAFGHHPAQLPALR